jgi:hypothetical protein
VNQPPPQVPTTSIANTAAAGATASRAQLFTSGAGAAATLGGAIAQIMAGVTARDQENENAKLLEALGLVNADEERRFTRSIIASQIAADTSGGGSAEDIILDTAVEGEVAALRKAFGFDAAASAARARGDSARQVGITRGVGTILGGFQRQLAQTPGKRETGGGGFTRSSPAQSGRIL